MFSFLIWLLEGAVIGWLAGYLMKDQGGALRNIVCGLLGGVVGGWLCSLLHLSGWFPGVVAAVLGACIVLYVGKRLFK